ncbi:MAG: F0F1 ATP synthase subunit A [Chloroflexi bacterium]|nr:F0F1 ATP synthase subunit A [Chloroflexota bacterium]
MARPKVLVTFTAVLALFIFGFLFLKGPLEVPTLVIEPVGRIGGESGYPIRSSVIQQWLAMLVLILFAFVATRKINIVPGRMQALAEIVVELFLGLCERAAGAKNGRRFFPVIATIFLFVVSANWLGLLPGTGTIGKFVGAEEVIEEARHHAEEKHETVDLAKLKLFVVDAASHNVVLGQDEFEVTGQEWEENKRAELEARGFTAGHILPYIRPANTDVNTPLAIALWSFIFVEFWGITTLGLFGYLGKFFNFRRLLRGNIAFGLIDVFVGLLELISEFVRLVSFTFRLFGNIFAGEILILMAGFFFPLVVVTGVFVMELFFGMIQAFIFAILTLIFAVLAVTSHGGHDEAHEAGH